MSIDYRIAYAFFIFFLCCALYRAYQLSEILRRAFRLYICFFATSFSCFFFSSPSSQQIRNRGFRLYICFFILLFLLFCHETKFHSSNSSMLCQLQLPSSQLHLTTMIEQQKSNGADGTWGSSTGKNEKYSDLRPFHTRFAN